MTLKDTMETYKPDPEPELTSDPFEFGSVSKDDLTPNKPVKWVDMHSVDPDVLSKLKKGTWEGFIPTQKQAEFIGDCQPLLTVKAKKLQKFIAATNANDAVNKEPILKELEAMGAIKKVELLTNSAFKYYDEQTDTPGELWYDQHAKDPMEKAPDSSDPPKLKFKGASFDIPLQHKSNPTGISHGWQKYDAEKYAKHQLEVASKWENFTELEPTFVELLQKDKSLSLIGAYELAHKLMFGALPKDKSYLDGTMAGLEASTEPFWKSQTIGKKGAYSLEDAFNAINKGVASAIWTQFDAAIVISKIQQSVKPLGYHICLGGSVLNKGQSNKDLDLYFLPMGSDLPTNPKGLINFLYTSWGEILPEVIGKSDQYPSAQLPYVAKLKFKHHGEKRIDVFVMGAEVFDVKACIAELPQGFILLNLDSAHVVKEGK